MVCQCGCGQPSPIAKLTNSAKGHVKGQPIRFVNGHNVRTHGGTYTPEYRAYDDAKRRCTNPRLKGFRHYGARGIEFRFTSFEQWFAELGPRPSPEHSIDRINNDGHYEPGNVKWSTKSEQNSNRRPFSEETCKKIGEHKRQYWANWRQAQAATA